ncbi:regulatory protein RecX, partial [Lacticaseibacillus paracasei subsp. paracasei Lpp71]
MSEITKITAQKRRGRYNIFIDGTYAFPVSETTLVDYRLA